MASESTVQRQVWSALSGLSRLFRTNSGKAWLTGGGKTVVRQDGTALVPYGRPVALGLAMANGDTVPGLSDLTGWTTITVTPDMVGSRVAVFTAVETKESGGGIRKENQRNYIKQVLLAGGIAGFASSPEQALEIIDAWKRGDVPL